MTDKTIRINKVLRELNISLERAVDFLKVKGIIIEANPNTKINDETYSILLENFNENKLISNKFSTYEFSNVDNRPKIIIDIENKYNITLKGRMHQIYKRNEYLIDKNNIIIGLNLEENFIEDISILKELKKLKYLNLSKNNIKDLSYLEHLVDLEVLILKENKINDISFLAEFHKLIELNLSLNEIEDVSFLSNFKTLKNLDLSNNFISNLIQLQFIEDIPLLNLRIENNPYFSYNNVVLKQNENHYKIIINELNKLEDLQIKAVLPEKIILLGNHASGKSSFLYYLQNEKLDYNHNTTHILKIEKYPEKYSKLPKAIVYDFGGQDFYHGIYQTFLTNHSITLLFWNIESNTNKILPDNDSKNRLNRNFNVTYWLGQRNHKGISGEVLVIQTKSDNINSKRKSYINSYEEITNEFYISLEKENIKSKRNRLKHLSLEYLKEYLDDVISKKQHLKNVEGNMSKPYYNFVKHIMDSPSNHLSIKKNDLKKKYKIESIERYDIDLEQLKRQGLILVYNDNVWLNPVALTEYVHKEILKEEIIGKGIISETIFKQYNFDEKIIELLIKEKVFFYHEFGLSDNNILQKEYIIPNYLPQISNSGIDYDLMTFGLDNPLFILKFKDYLPFGLINQLVCYFGNLPDRKKFWREHLIFTIDKKVKILIELDFEQSEVKIFGIYCKEANENYKNKIEQYLFYIIMSMYWDFDELPENFDKYNVAYNKIQINLQNEMISDVSNLRTLDFLMHDFYTNASCRPEDLFISKEGNLFVKYVSLFTINENETNIKAYKKDENKELEEYKEIPVINYQNFTHISLKKIKKIFISYSRKDVDYKNELKKHLNILKTFDISDNWSCEEITIGKWDSQIQKELEESDLIIYMLSANFLTSKYILEKEVQKGMDLINENKEKNILCVIVSDFIGLDRLKNAVELNEINSLQESLLSLSNYQYLPYGNKFNKVNNQDEEVIIPLKNYANIETAFKQITEKILAEVSN
jgi:internalin A